MYLRFLGILLTTVLAIGCALEDPGETPSGAPVGEAGLTIGETGLTADQIRRAFMRTTACDGIGGLGRYYAFVLELEFRGPKFGRAIGEELLCTANAADCAAVELCKGTPAECEANSQRCDGSAIVSCTELASGQTMESRQDCADDPNGNTRCDPESFECVAPDPCEASHCADDAAVICSEGVGYRIDCAERGGRCVEGDGEVYCEEIRDAPCDRTCEGNVALRCEDRVVIEKGNCAALGLTCVEGDCVVAPFECDPGAVRCTGAVAEHCLGGKWFAFDCAEVGAQCVLPAERPGDFSCWLADK